MIITLSTLFYRIVKRDWFAIAPDEIRTRRILREKADCKQSREGEKKKYKPHREKLEKLVEKA